MKMRKIVAIVAAVLMLFSVIPFSAMAADTTVVFKLGADGSASHNDGSEKSSYTETVDGYTLNISGCTKMYTGARDQLGNGCLKLGTSKAVGGFTINVPDDVTSVIIAAGKYKTNTTKLSVAGTTHTLTNSSNNGQYDEITVDTTTNKTIAVTTVSGGARAMINSITYVIPASNADCDHSQYTCGDTCEVCGEVFAHEYSKACTEVCENDCGTANPDAVAHTYTHSLASFCSVCGDERTVVMPTDPAELVDAAYALPANEAFPEAVTLTGIISSVDTAFDPSYNNVTVTIDVLDSEGNVIADKPIQCFRLKGTGADIIAEGDTITVSGIILYYNGKTVEFNAGCTLVSYEQTGCEHVYEYECSTTCEVCGKGVREAVCVTDAQFACADGLCVYCGNDVNALEHAFDDEWDPDCNYGCGYTREVEEKPDMTEATITFGEDKAQRTEFTTELQKWEHDGLVLINNKAASTTNIGDYAGRFYKSSEVIISFPGMTSLVIDCSNTGEAKYSTPWGDMLTAAGLTYTVENKIYTVTFAEPTDSITLSCSAQVRANAITATAVKVGDDECAHEFSEATCTKPATCTLCGAVDGAALGHSYEETVAQAPTCTNTGLTTYSCTTCGDYYEKQIAAAGHNFVDGNCAVCGAELPLEATITFGDDKAQRVEFSTESQKWANDGLVLINNKAGSTNAIGDYTNPAGRFYKDSEIIISFPGMTSLVIDATGMDSDRLWDASLTAAGLSFTVENKIYTITFAEPTDSITLTAANQVRANSITATRVVPCAHEYDNACDVDCNLCYETREVSHNVVHVEAVAATCATDGNLEHWYCNVCGAAWLDAECTLNTNLKAVKLPATGEHEYDNACDVDCNLCYETREVSHNVVYVEAKAPTCTAEGNIEYWFCDVCGAAWLDAECTLNTNLKAVKLPATGEHTYDDEYDADCNVCGEEREVEQPPVEDIVYGDADGDGEITMLDSALLSQYLSDWEVELDMAAADVDGDGEVTMLDSALLSQYLSDWDVTLGPEETKIFNDGVLSGWGE